MCPCKGEKNMLTDTALVKKKTLRKPILRKSKFSSMSRSDWIEANEVSKKTRGLSKLTYRDLFGDK
jgi:hypothetical protein